MLALSKPGRPEIGASAERRSYHSAETRCASLSAMKKAVALAFGEASSSVERLLVALMADSRPAQLYCQFKPACGVPILPMEAKKTHDVDFALASLTGSVVMIEQLYSGVRIQVHKLNDSIIIFGPDQKDLTSSFDTRLLTAVSAAIKVKTCIIEAILQENGYIWAFDCLLLNESPLTRVRLQARREALQRAFSPSGEFQVMPSEEFPLDDPPSKEVVTSLLEEADTCGCQGVVLKCLETEYQAGSISESWISLLNPIV